MNTKHDNIFTVIRSAAAITTAVAITCIAAPAVAGDNIPYRVAAITDTAEGHLIMKRNYTAAIEKLERRNRRGIDAFYAATNLCVAYLKSGEIDDAESSCTLAVDRIEALLSNHRRADSIASITTVRRYLALALSNRGVVYAVSGRDALARADFEAAEEISPQLDEPAINLSGLSRRPSPDA